jgi:hypothetical protein
VHSGFEEVVLCSVAWGKRPAFAWLLRERRQRGQERPGPFKLGFLLFSTP